MAGDTFHLVDMATQFEELERFLRGKPLEEKERWIASQGELVRVRLPNESFPMYSFTSAVGIRWPFGIRGEEIILIGDHHVLPRKA